MFYYGTLLQAIVLVSYGTNILCTVLQVAAKVPMYHVQNCTKLHLGIVRHGTILQLVLMVKTLY